MSEDMSLIQKIAELRKKVKGFEKKQENDFFGSKFFNISQMIEKIQPVCERLDIMIQQPIDCHTVSGCDSLVPFNVLQLIICDVKTGEKEVLGKMQLPQINDPQKIGSAITYYRRYMLKSALFWEDADDDGNDAKLDYFDDKEELEDYIARYSINEKKLLDSYQVDSIEQMSDTMIADALNKVKKKYE